MADAAELRVVETEPEAPEPKPLYERTREMARRFDRCRTTSYRTLEAPSDTDVSDLLHEVADVLLVSGVPV